MFTSGSCAGAQCGEVEEVAADKRQVQKLPRDKNSFIFGMLPVTGIGSELQRIGMMRTVSGDVQFAP